MSGVFKAHYSKNATVWGLAISLMIVIPLGVVLYLGRYRPSVFLFFMGTVLALIVGFMIYLTISGRKMNYALDEDEFRVNFGAMGFKTPYTFIENVERAHLTLILRLFGGSWPGLHWGLFQAKDVGRVHVYATKMRGDFVVIKLVNGKKVAITPEASEAFITKITSWSSRFRTASPRDVEIFEAPSKKMVYTQVLMVTVAFLGVLTYLFWIYPSLPEIIPVHFDINWNPNRWAHKSELFIIAGIAALFPIINAILVLKFGKYGKGVTTFLGALFILVIALFFGIVQTITSMLEI